MSSRIFLKRRPFSHHKFFKFVWAGVASGFTMCSYSWSLFMWKKTERLFCVLYLFLVSDIYVQLVVFIKNRQYHTFYTTKSLAFNCIYLQFIPRISFWLYLSTGLKISFCGKDIDSTQLICSMSSSIMRRERLYHIFAHISLI